MHHMGEINGKKVGITDHALHRMVEMGMTAEEFKLLVSDPDEVYDSVKYPGRSLHRRSPYSIAFAQDGDCIIVITVLWATQSDWLKANKEKHMGEGRVINFESLKGIPRF